MGAVLRKICPCFYGAKTVREEEKEPLLSSKRNEHDGKSTPPSGYHTPKPGSSAASTVNIDTPPRSSPSGSETDTEPEKTTLPDKITLSDSGHFEQDVLYNKVLTTDAIKHAALVSYPQGTVKAANFSVKQKGVFDIIEALQGNTQAIAEYGIELSGETPTYIPGKLEDGKAIYATAVSSTSTEDSISVSGGCTVYKTNKYLLITTFEKEQDVAVATRITSEVADDLISRGQ